MKRFSLLIALAFCLIMEGSVTTMSQTATPKDDFTGLNSLLHQGRYLSAIRLLETQEAWSNDSARLQFLSWVYGAVGRHREAQEAFNRAMGTRKTPPEPTEEECRTAAAMPLQTGEKVILDAVKSHRIVILNETHHQLEHRAFGASLIPKLQALGVQYFALETGSQTPLDAAVRTGQITAATDSYSFEPRRAELLRAVVRAGIKIVAFDHRTPAEDAEVAAHPERSIAVRETAMARNIDEQILRRDPAAKVLIWVGMSHACKRPQGEQEWMALRLWKRTGIEPFTIYQMSDAGAPEQDEPIYRLLLKTGRRRIKAPMAIQLPLASFAEPIPSSLRRNPVYEKMIERGVDAVILHPLSPFETSSGRPAWLQPENGAQIEGRILLDNLPCEGYLVQAVLAGEEELSTPADQVLTDHAGHYQLRVRAGHYTLRVWSPADRSQPEQPLFTFPSLACRPHQRIQQPIILPAK